MNKEEAWGGPAYSGEGDTPQEKEANQAPLQIPGAALRLLCGDQEIPDHPVCTSSLAVVTFQKTRINGKKGRGPARKRGEEIILFRSEVSWEKGAQACGEFKVITIIAPLKGI